MEKELFPHFPYEMGKELFTLLTWEIDIILDILEKYNSLPVSPLMKHLKCNFLKAHWIYAREKDFKRLKSMRKNGLKEMNLNFMPPWSQFLNDLRTQENMTQQELSKLSGISQTKISKMENGEKRITSKEATKLSEIFKCDPELFLKN